MAMKVATPAKRTATQRAATACAAVATSSTDARDVELANLKARIAWLSRQARDVDANVASMTHTYCELGERSDWQDEQLPALDETITFWTHRYEALRAQLTEARAQLVSLIVQASKVSDALAW